MVCLASRQDRKVASPPQTTTLMSVAEVTRVPTGYLSKVLQALTRAGLVNSLRGIRGGFCLARPAGDISLYEVVQAVDPLQRIMSCPLSLASHQQALCPLHGRLDQAFLGLERALRETTLEELVRPAKPLPPGCRFPRQGPSGRRRTASLKP